MAQDNLTQGNRGQVSKCLIVGRCQPTPNAAGWVNKGNGARGFDFPSVKNTVALGGHNEISESQTPTSSRLWSVHAQQGR